VSRLYRIGNHPMVTTAAPVKVTTGTAIKTMLQVQTSAATPLLVVEWGIDFDGSALATPGVVELIDTFAIPATSLTAHVAAGAQPFNEATQSALDVVFGTGATGFAPAGAPTEGTITQTRTLDTHLIDPVNNWSIQWPLDREPEVAVSRNLRIRVTFGTAINCLCYVIVGPS
jgi:hypothetical protein